MPCSLRAALLVSGLLLAACGAESRITTPKTTLSYSGVFAGEDGTEAGSFSVTVVVEDSTASGNFVVNGASHSFTSGAFDGTDVTASGAGYIFAGTATDSAVAGGYESASGGGLFTGLRRFTGITGQATAAPISAPTGGSRSPGRSPSCRATASAAVCSPRCWATRSAACCARPAPVPP